MTHIERRDLIKAPVPKVLENLKNSAKSYVQKNLSREQRQKWLFVNLQKILQRRTGFP